MARLDLPPLPDGPWDAPETWLPSAEQLVEGARSTLAALPALDGIFAELGAPPADFLTAPYEARATLLGAAAGRAFFHHEANAYLPVIEDAAPELAVWDGETVPEWQAGVLEEPKYFGFAQDAPLTAFHPNHRRRWRPHEQLHGAVGWFWRPDQTRFEAYLGARLNELLPVVHWYGTAELLRRRCPAHRGGPIPTRTCTACEDPGPGTRPVDADAARAFAAHAIVHLDSELRAIAGELQTGRVHATPRPGLDASSDAIGYLRGHWNRLCSWGHGAWVERFCVAGVDHETSIADLAERVAASARALWGGTLEVHQADFERLRARRLVQQLGRRTLRALEWLQPGSLGFQEALAAADGPLEALQALQADLLSGKADATEAHITAAIVADELDALALPPSVGGRIGGLAAMWWRAPGPASADQVVDGLDSALPSAAGEVAGLAKLGGAFVESPEFAGMGDLGGRFGRWIERLEPQTIDLTPVQAADLVFEGWLRALPRQDLDASRFAVMGDSAELAGPEVLSELRPHASLRRRAFAAHDVRRWLDDTESDTESDTEIELVAAWVEDLPVVLTLESPLRSALDRITGIDPTAPATPEALAVLVAHGLVVWSPRPR